MRLSPKTALRALGWTCVGQYLSCCPIGFLSKLLPERLHVASLAHSALPTSKCRTHPSRSRHRHHLPQGRRIKKSLHVFSITARLSNTINFVPTSCVGKFLTRLTWLAQCYSISTSGTAQPSELTNGTVVEPGAESTIAPLCTTSKSRCQC